MDEPTNDLDVETLGAFGRAFAGLRRHVASSQPRPRFLDNVVTQLWVFEGEGHIDEQVGGTAIGWSARKPASKPLASAKPASGSKTAEVKALNPVREKTVL